MLGVNLHLLSLFGVSGGMSVGEYPFSRPNEDTKQG